MTPVLNRRERERKARRRLMLEAARAVFAEKGYRRATLDEIAQRAEFGKGTLYNYFEGGKEELLLAVLDDVYADLHALALRVFSDLEPDAFRTRLHQFVTQMLGYLYANHELVALLTKEAHRMAFDDDPEKVAYFMRQHQRIVDVLLPAFERAVAEGVLKPLPVAPMVHMLMGHIDVYMRFHYMCSHTGPDAAQPMPTVAQAADFLTRVLIDGMGTDAPAIPPETDPFHA